jgi:hypothetical protein
MIIARIVGYGTNLEGTVIPRSWMTFSLKV